MGTFDLIWLIICSHEVFLILVVLCVGWVESEFEMTSVTSTRELRPVPRQLVQMVRDPASLSVIYHGGARGEERDSEPVEVGGPERESGHLESGHLKIRTS